MFDKVKAVLITAALAALAGIGPALNDVDWGGFGNFGPAIGLAVGAAVAWAVRETTNYGQPYITDEGDDDANVGPDGQPIVQ